MLNRRYSDELNALFNTDGPDGAALPAAGLPAAGYPAAGLPAAALTPPPLIRADHINVDVISKILQHVLSNFNSRDHHHFE